MSLWADYSEERWGIKTLEVEGGFISYEIKPPECSIEDIYVKPELRGTPLGKRLADQVFSLARKENCERMWLRIIPQAKGSTYAMQASLKYGFKLSHVSGQDILLMKEIGSE